MPKEFRAGTSCAFPVRSTAALCQPFVSYEWTDAKGGDWGGLKISVEMTLSGDEIEK